MSSARVLGVDAPVRFRLRTAGACLPSAVRVFFGMWAIVFFRFAVLIALRTFFFAAFRCLVVTTAHLLRACAVPTPGRPEGCAPSLLGCGDPLDNRVHDVGTLRDAGVDLRESEAQERAPDPPADAG